MIIDLLLSHLRVRRELSSQTAEFMDPMQFAYQLKRGVEDATLTLLNKIFSHLDIYSTHVRILFMDFSLAFNTVQPHLLLKRLIDLNTNSSLVLWIREFLRAIPACPCQ